jgi:hypothetical protein
MTAALLALLLGVGSIVEQAKGCEQPPILSFAACVQGILARPPFKDEFQ